MKKPFAITLDVGTSLENRTGSWRTLRPTYVHKLPPCNHPVSYTHLTLPTTSRV